MDYASRDSMQLLAIGLISIAAIALGAATIEATVDAGAVGSGDANPLIPSGGQGGGGLNESELDGNGSMNLDGGQGGGIVAQVSTCIDPLSAWYGTLVYFGAFGGVMYLIKRTYSLGASILGMYALAPVAFTAYFLGTNCASTLDDNGGDNNAVETISEVAGTSVLSPDVSPVVIAGVFGLALIAVVAVLVRASGDQTVTALEDEDDLEDGQPDVADLAAAAGEAADRLEKHDADVDNEVYRAWWEMTSLLNVPDPGTSTPGEFADAAIAAGLDADHVNRLTELFEEVRYGRRDAAEREERAIDIFRAIESQYGDADAEDGGTDGR